jgi:RNA polymerase sigma-70 factor (ECF subfamily)
LEHSICEEKNYHLLYLEHAKQIRNFIYYKCGDLQQAEDLTHEAYIKLWDNCKKVVIEKAKSFLMTVVNRLFLNTIEHHKVVLNFEKSSTKKHDHEDPEYVLNEKQFKERLELAISDLPEGQRSVFLMNRVDKMSYQEIADLQGVSIKAIHKRMYKAMDKLKLAVQELNDYKI